MKKSKSTGIRSKLQELQMKLRGKYNKSASREKSVGDVVGSGLYAGLKGLLNMFGLGEMVDTWVKGSEGDSDFYNQVSERTAKDAALRQRAINRINDLITRLDTAAMGLSGNSAVRIGDNVNKLKKDAEDMNTHNSLINAVEQNILSDANDTKYDDAVARKQSQKSVRRKEKDKDALQKTFNERFEAYIR